MKPDLWGPHLWATIHYIALGYPDTPTPSQVEFYRDFFLNLWKVIPCYKCGVNYKRHLEEMPLDGFLDSRDTLFNWTVALHNLVNFELKKPIISVEDAYSIYINDGGSNSKEVAKKYGVDMKIICVISAVVISFIFLYMLILLKKR